MLACSMLLSARLDAVHVHEDECGVGCWRTCHAQHWFNLALVLCLQVNVPLRAYLSTHPDLRIVSVACGHSHTLAIAETGSVWSCGRNGDGQ